MQFNLEELMESGFCLIDQEMILAYTPYLLQNLGSTISDDRENSLTILSTWIESHRYPAETFKNIAEQMLQNLAWHLGETEDDSVFLRAFSALILGEILEHDQAAAQEGYAFLDENDFHHWLPTVLDCFSNEQDLRGFVEVKGWAHSVAHYGDLLLAFSRHRFCTVAEMQTILNTIAQKFIQPANSILQYQEDERLARVVVSIIRSQSISASFQADWFQRFYSLSGNRPWTDAYSSPQENHARYNTRAFLHSLYLQFYLSGETARDEALCKQILAALQAMDCGRFYPPLPAHEE